MADGMYGKCSVCGKEGPLMRTYWHYDIKCECCSPKHFEYRCHCLTCVPTEPRETRVSLLTSNVQSSLKRTSDVEKLFYEHGEEVAKGLFLIRADDLGFMRREDGAK